MDSIYAQPLVEMGVSLTDLAIKGTATAVTNKIKAVKEEKNIEKIRNTYDEIVNELLSERDEAVRIAQAYKSELERIVISDDDIVHLHNTVSRILEIVKAFQLVAATAKGQEEVEKVISNQFSYDKIAPEANIEIINNDGTVQELKNKLIEAIDKIIKRRN